ncbi:MAG: bifunctional adenosylcobinamide kinase/adenosylcobinamide-phosphate guanylyltransferase [Actinobacteria bacterium]|nr:bifunctional adenosylcobinamide kinase/adenosylcobinamide-phosphate guanylyltransferase [Actinomycetota bacterium]
MGFIFLTGGIRSGKSSLAVRWSRDTRGPVTYIATAEPGDHEMAARIDRHRNERPEAWFTREVPIDLADALRGVEGGSAIVDCLTLWVSNLMQAGSSDEEVLARSQEAASVASESRADVYVISNEVGSGIVPANELARRYEDLLGRVNAMWASRASSAFLVVAGRFLRLEKPG